jgi:uncharacterized secreted protein with C-terminal beta-propeller domain
VQEVGVDEPDVWKTDGRRIVAMRGNTLHVLNAAEGGVTSLGQVDLGSDGWDGQVLVAGDRALVMTQTGGLFWNGSNVAVQDSAAGAMGSTALPLPSARLIEVDLSDPAAPRVAADLRVEGSYVNARMVGTTVRVVLQSTPSKLEFLAPGGPSSEEKARKANMTVIDESTVDQWLPSFVLERDGKQASGQLVDCARVHHPPTFAGFSALSVLTVDLAKSLTPGDAVAILGDGQRVYASTDNLYVGVNRYEVPASGDNATTTTVPGAPPETTVVHKFSIAGTGPATYRASGQVRGHLMDELSMSEYQGNLRVATTDPARFSGAEPAIAVVPNGPTVGPSARGQSAAATTASEPTVSESYVTVLAEQGKELVQVGQVGGLGKGESIHAVRFDGPVGYVVTFRQTDPLYTVDLTDPAQPRTRGELKLLGFSAYLHPLGNGRLLGIGQDATEQGRITGAQVSLFDVTDLDHPRLVNQVALPAGWSQVGHDYHAFLWWEPAKLAAVPMAIPDYIASAGTGIRSDGFGFSGLAGFTVDGDQLAERGRISHPQPPAPDCSDGPVPAVRAGSATAVPGVAAQPSIAPTAPACFVAPAPAITRSMVIGDTLYTLSGAGVKASALADLADKAWLPLA